MGNGSGEHLVGRTIAGKFVVESLLGSGAMGAVFRARQIALEKTVAIKVLHGEHAGDPTFAARFHREAKAASRLNHPNSMQVLDFGAEPDGLLYIAMEYLDGRSLHRLLREEGILPPTRIADILMQTLAALAVAHDMGVVHRDLKPENIMVLRGTDDDGRTRDIVKVCDFGIAKITDSRAYGEPGLAEPSGPATTSGFLVGTPEYMSPEQGRGERLDARSDLYSVAVILFEMLAGRVPFTAEGALGVVLKHVTDAPPRPSHVRPGVDLRLEAICLRALRKAPDERYQSAREMRSDLRSAVLTPTDPRGRLPSGPDFGGVGALAASPPSTTGFSETVQMPAVAAAEAPPKATLLGTSSTVPGLPRRRAPLVIAAAAACVSALAGAMLLVVQPRWRSKATAPVVASREIAPPTTVEPLPVTAASVPPLELLTTAPGAGVGGGPPVRASPLPPLAASVAPRRSPSNSVPATSDASALAVTPSTATTAQANAVAPPQPTPSLLPVPTAEPADTSFDPSRGYVEVGLINAQGVRESAVRGALRGVSLSPCYREALVARGARATGVAVLNLSIDESGATRSAIVTGANFLPGLARCIQAVGTGVSVPKSKVDSGGGTVEVTLAFKLP
jgi:serine/threonine-protein kinase